MVIIKDSRGVGRAVAKGTIQGWVAYLWFKVVLPLLVPIGTPAVTVFLGWSQGVLWMWIWLAMLATPFFALASWREIDARRRASRIDDKVTFELGAASDISIGPDGKRIVMCIQPFVQMINNSDYDISVVVESMDTRIDNLAARYRAGARRAGEFTIPPKRGVQARDIALEVPDGITGERAHGSFRYRLRYGLAGKEALINQDWTTFEMVNLPSNPGVIVNLSPATDRPA
jgi:hypothetical protein